MQGVDGLLPGASSNAVKMYTKTCNHVHFCHYFERKNLTFTLTMCCTQHHKYAKERLSNLASQRKKNENGLNLEKLVISEVRILTLGLDHVQVNCS